VSEPGIFLVIAKYKIAVITTTNNIINNIIKTLNFGFSGIKLAVSASFGGLGRPVLPYGQIGLSFFGIIIYKYIIIYYINNYA
jgi:hypothetical protein